MSKTTFTGFMFLLLLLFASPDANSNNSAPRKQTIPDSSGQSGTRAAWLDVTLGPDASSSGSPHFPDGGGGARRTSGAA